MQRLPDQTPRRYRHHRDAPPLYSLPGALPRQRTEPHQALLPFRPETERPGWRDVLRRFMTRLTYRSRTGI